jgi:hypothetical protein
MGLSKADIIGKAHQRRIEKVSVPEWGGDVHVRSLTGTERDRFDAWAEERKKRLGTPTERSSDQAVTGRLCTLAICDEQGVALFGEDDAEALGATDGAGLNRVVQKIQQMAGLGVQAMETARGN